MMEVNIYFRKLQVLGNDKINKNYNEDYYRLGCDAV
jgi:hypothetical protein